MQVLNWIVLKEKGLIFPFLFGSLWCLNSNFICFCSLWRLGKRHPGLQALFLSDCSPSISDQDVCRWANKYWRWSNHIQLLSSTSLTIVLFKHIGNAMLEWNIRQWGSSPPSSSPKIHRLASSFPCLVELGIGQNMLLTDSSLSSVARSSRSFNIAVI